jgi:hypothetical protein
VGKGHEHWNHPYDHTHGGCVTDKNITTQNETPSSR